MKKIIIGFALIPTLSFGNINGTEGGGGQILGREGGGRTTLTLRSQGDSVNSKVLGTDTGGGFGRVTGVDTGGGFRTILRAEINNIRPLTPQELATGIDTATGHANRLNSISRYALDLSNISEITLKDGTVLNKVDIEERIFEMAIGLK
jgi:hypothetical protein